MVPKGPRNVAGGASHRTWRSICMRPGRGAGVSRFSPARRCEIRRASSVVRSFRRPVRGGYSCVGGFRWLAPPATFRRPFGTSYQPRCGGYSILGGPSPGKRLPQQAPRQARSGEPGRTTERLPYRPQMASLPASPHKTDMGGQRLCATRPFRNQAIVSLSG
jgi:hypothetical protein